MRRRRQIGRQKQIVFCENLIDTFRTPQIAVVQKKFINALTMLWNLLWVRKQALDGREEGLFIGTDEKIPRKLSERLKFVCACRVRVDEQHLGIG
jgi:hypothetical protein